MPANGSVEIRNTMADISLSDHFLGAMASSYCTAPRRLATSVRTQLSEYMTHVRSDQGCIEMASGAGHALKRGSYVYVY